jgi:hypothetical protein
MTDAKTTYLYDFENEVYFLIGGIQGWIQFIQVNGHSWNDSKWTMAHFYYGQGILSPKQAALKWFDDCIESKILTINV